MSQEKIKSMHVIADMHAKRIEDAVQQLKNNFPTTSQSVQHFTEQEILLIEMLTSRFAKLQDYLGANVFDLFFDETGENVNGMTMIDKLHRLEQLYILDDTQQWMEMRKVRNIIEHEYPDNPLLVSNTLNEIYKMCPILIAIKDKVFAKLTT
jgi:hypothetical protein